MKNMVEFKDISNFSNIGDYLPILNAVLFVDVSGIYLSLNNVIKSKYLRLWYEKFGLLAVLADVLIIVLGIIATRFIYSFFFKSFSIIKFTLIAWILQMIHDILFYVYFSRIVPKGSNTMFDIFKEYAKEVGSSAIFGDSIMIISACFIASGLANYSANLNIILLMFTLYLMSYILNYTS